MGSPVTGAPQCFMSPTPFARFNPYHIDLDTAWWKVEMYTSRRGWHGLGTTKLMTFTGAAKTLGMLFTSYYPLVSGSPELYPPIERYRIRQTKDGRIIPAPKILIVIQPYAP